MALVSCLVFITVTFFFLLPLPLPFAVPVFLLFTLLISVAIRPFSVLIAPAAPLHATATVTAPLALAFTGFLTGLPIISLALFAVTLVLNLDRVTVDLPAVEIFDCAL